MSNNFIGNIKEYSFLEVVFTGSFSTCYKVVRKKNGKIFIWKAIDYGRLSETNYKTLSSDVEVLITIRHPNIVQFFEQIHHKATLTLYMVMEFCDGGTLASLVKKCKVSNSFVNESLVWKIMYQLSRALQVCHSKLSKVTTLHCDITATQVFLDNCGNAKLCGFELSKKILSNNHSHLEYENISPYTSPEVLMGKPHSKTSDIWSLGCLIYELSSLTLPYYGVNANLLLDNIQNHKRKEIPIHYSRELQKAISMMLEISEEKRPSSEVISYHPEVISHIASGGLEKLSIGASMKNSIQRDSSLSLPKAKLRKLCFKCRDLEMKHDLLRQKENLLKAKEFHLKEKEHTLNKREKQILLLEHLNKEKLARTENYMKECRRVSKTECLPDLNESSYSADNGELNILPTATKLNPKNIPVPLFLRNTSNRRTVHFENLEFFNAKDFPSTENRRQKSKVMDFSVAASKKKIIPSNKKYQLDNNQFKKIKRGSQNKENDYKVKDCKSNSVTSLNCNTEELYHGILETHFC